MKIGVNPKMGNGLKNNAQTSLQLDNYSDTKLVNTLNPRRPKGIEIDKIMLVVDHDMVPKTAESPVRTEKRQ